MERISQNENLWSKTFLITSNNPMVFEHCDRVIVLQNGKIIYQGSYKDSPIQTMSQADDDQDEGFEDKYKVRE